MAGQRACLGSDAFLHVAVAAQTDHMLIENLVLIRIETCRRHLCRHGNPNRVADSLTEWARCAFHTGRLAKFRVPRRFGMQLAETLDLRHRQVVTAHVQPGVQEHAAVPAGEDEDIAIDPARFVWIVL